MAFSQFGPELISLDLNSIRVPGRHHHLSQEQRKAGTRPGDGEPFLAPHHEALRSTRGGDFAFPTAPRKVSTNTKLSCLRGKQTCEQLPRMDPASGLVAFLRRKNQTKQLLDRIADTPRSSLALGLGVFPPWTRQPIFDERLNVGGEFLPATCPGPLSKLSKSEQSPWAALTSSR